MSNMVPVRDIETVTAEINIITVQTQRGLLTGAIEIGRRLVEAKSMVPHGEWGKYLQERVNYSQSSANNLMKLYQEYGDNQASLFDDFANSQTFQNLTYTKALAMLALPAEMRQSFAEEHDVENKSTREVQAEVQEELEKLKAEKEQAEKKLDEACEHNDDLRQRLEEERAEKEDLRDQVEADEEKLSKLQKEKEKAELSEQNALRLVDKLNKKVAAAEKAEQTAKDALKQAQEHPEIPESLMEEMRRQVAADAAKQATEDLQKQLDAAKEQAEAAAKAKQTAESATKEMQEKLAAAERAAKMQNPDVAVFQSLYIQLQETWNRTVGAYNKVLQGDDTSAANCKRALEAAIQKFQSDIAGKV